MAPKKGSKRKKSSSLGRGSRSSGNNQKRLKVDEQAAAAANVRSLEQQVLDLQAKLVQQQFSVDAAQTGAVAAVSGLIGTHRRRSSIGAEDEEADADPVGSPNTGEAELQVESLDERATRLSAELGTVSNRPGRSRSYEENRTFVFSCLKVEKDVLESCEERERPKLKKIAIEVAALMGYDRAFGQELMANWRLDKTILVHETQERGKGSPGYANGSFVDTARRLAPAHLKAIEEFRRTCHAEGGVCSVRTVVQHLNTLFYADGSLVSSLLWDLLCACC